MQVDRLDAQFVRYLEANAQPRIDTGKHTEWPSFHKNNLSQSQFFNFSRGFRADKYFEIAVPLNQSYIIKKITGNVLQNQSKISAYIGVTIETYQEDKMQEELLCIFGFNKINELL